jgi:polyribonucleotide nucleotidyltransferase
MAILTSEKIINGIAISLETGRMAKQAGGAVVVRIGDTMLLSTVCSTPAKEVTDFFPLTVEYFTKAYAAGKIPGGFVKREGKPTERDILSARIVDRPIRPLFPAGFCDEVQVVNTVISADEKYNADIMAISAASCALCLSSLPFSEPVAGVRIGKVDGKLTVFPTIEETEAGGLDLVVAGTGHSIMMVEGGCYELSENEMIEAIIFAHEQIKELIVLQKDLLAKAQIPEKIFTPPPAADAELVAAVKELINDRIHDISFIGLKQVRYSTLDKLYKEIQEKLKERFPEKEAAIQKVLADVEYSDMRSTIIEKGIRIGGRDCDTIRAITCELDVLPRAHGSTLFTRGETQSLVVTTLGTKMDEQRIEDIQAEYKKSYMLHYNFPPYSVGEVKRLGTVGRREIGHGHLAERSLAPILPNVKRFPYTIRIVSEILESNGSSSMASVCGGSLSLMAAGVPIKAHVAGVAMGLIKEGDKVVILTDILGTEDHLGDMDFKVAGTREGITAIQMDIKIAGITPEIMREALAKACVARNKIIEIMEKAIPKSRADLCPYAPRITTVVIDKEKIGEIIGPGGRVIREIQESTGATITVEESGTVQIFASDKNAAEAAVKRIKGIVADPEVGAVYEAKIKTVVDFGAFAEYMPGKDGLIHISELDIKRVARVEDVVRVGDTVKVKLIGIERGGKVRLSMKALM